MKLLNICGADDMMFHPGVQKMQYDAYPAKDKHKIELVTYPGTGHIIDPPYVPVTSSAYHKVYSEYINNKHKLEVNVYCRGTSNKLEGVGGGGNSFFFGVKCFFRFMA